MSTELQQQILEKYRAIESIPTQKSPRRFKPLLTEIIQLVGALPGSKKDNQKLAETLQATLERELPYLEESYRQTQKKDATRRDTINYYKELDRAIRYVEFELNSVIKEPKTA